MSPLFSFLTRATFVLAIVFLGSGESSNVIAAEAPAIAMSTHLLDSATGLPVAGVPVRLERQGELLGEGVTDKDGRLALGPKRLEPGTYKLIFAIGDRYPKGFYPEITLTVRISEPEAHLHLPILLSPFAYTTYRGS